MSLTTMLRRLKTGWSLMVEVFPAAAALYWRKGNSAGQLVGRVAQLGRHPLGGCHAGDVAPLVVQMGLVVIAAHDGPSSDARKPVLPELPAGPLEPQHASGLLSGQ